MSEQASKKDVDVLKRLDALETQSTTNSANITGLEELLGELDKKINAAGESIDARIVAWVTDNLWLRLNTMEKSIADLQNLQSPPSAAPGVGERVVFTPARRLPAIADAAEPAEPTEASEALEAANITTGPLLQFPARDGTKAMLSITHYHKGSPVLVTSDEKGEHATVAARFGLDLGKATELDHGEFAFPILGTK